MTGGRAKSSSQSNPFRVLSIDGGGFLGLATAVFIQQLERHFSFRFSGSFDLMCGTSTGAIISAALAIGKSGNEIVSLYEELGPLIFGKKKSWGYCRSYYAQEDLQACLEAHLGSVTLGDVFDTGNRIAITAFNRTTGEPRVFKTDHSDNLSNDSQLKLVDVVIASASAPTFFPSHKILNPATGQEEVFCDGGVVCNHPALLGFTEASFEIGVIPEDIRILSLSTPRESLAEGDSARHKLDQGKWQWKDSIHQIFIDSNSEMVHQSLRRLIDVYGEKKPRYARIDLANPDRLKIDDISASATEKLKAIGANAATQRMSRDLVSSIIN